jgi:hypothetical protein
MNEIKESSYGSLSKERHSGENQNDYDRGTPDQQFGKSDLVQEYKSSIEAS